MKTYPAASRLPGSAALIGCIGLVFCPTVASAQELPPEIQMDRYMVQVDRQIRNEQYAAALRTLGMVLELQATHDLELPASFWMKRAIVAIGTEDYTEAMASLVQYLDLVGREGEQYADALELLDQAVEQGCTAQRMTESVERVRACLAQGADPNTVDASAKRPLDWAAEREDPGISAALIAAGADPVEAASATAGADSAVAPPGQAIIPPRDHSVGDLVGGKCEDWNTQKFFEVATAADVTRCLERGADLKALTELYRTDIEWEFPAKWSPIHLALVYGGPDVVTTLLNAGADPNHELRGYWRRTNDFGRTAIAHMKLSPLHLAATSGSTRTVRALLNAGADVHARDFHKATPLHFATVSGSGDVAVMLMEAGADVNASTEDMPSPLWLAARVGSAEIFEALVTAGADANYGTDESYPDLCIPTRCPQIDEIGGVVGKTVLFAAAAGDCATCILLLVAAGVDVDGWVPGRRILVGGDGLEYFATPLHEAADHGAASAIEVLLDLGANVTYRQMFWHDDLRDPTAWDLAHRRGLNDPEFRISEAYRRLRELFR